MSLHADPKYKQLVSSRWGCVWAALALALAVFGCASVYRYAQAPRVTLAGMRIVDLSLFQQRYMLALRVENPNPVALPIEGLSYSLDVNGSEFAHGVNNQKTTVPAFGEQILQVGVVTDLLSTIEQLRRWGEQPPQNLDYSLRGKVQVPNLSVGLPFDYSGKISLQGSGASEQPE